jgi:thiol-disulfide isomerase/thioredoxin
MPNVIATPHGLGQAAEARRRNAEMAERSMLSLIAGELPELTVNREVKWRAALDPGDLGGPLGERATLVQFSSAFCQPCRATRRVLDEVSSQVEGVRHVEIDAESHLELVRRLDIRRTPTVLVLDAAGRIVRRASGQPRTVDVVAALGAAVDA